MAMFETLESLYQSLTLAFGLAIYLFGFGASAIVLIVTLIEIISKKNWFALIAVTMLAVVIIVIGMLFGGDVAFAITAILTIAISIYVLLIKKRSAKTWFLTFFVSVCAVGSLMYILPNVFWGQYGSENLASLAFLFFAPSILVRLTYRALKE